MPLVSRADSAEVQDTSEKKAEGKQRERKYHQYCHLERVKQARQMTRGGGYYGD